MNQHMCLRCLYRVSSRPLRTTPIPSPSPGLTPAAAFFTTSSLPRANTTVSKTKTGAASARRKKQNAVTTNVRKPAIGERKALRKRVVLSNTNALEVRGLQDISISNMMDEEMQGKVLGIPGEVVDRLRAVEAFKPAQGWGMYRRPAMLMREETLGYAKMMDSIGTDSMRRVIVGERGSGKTTMLLQAMTLAFLKGWVVISIPEAQDLTIAHTEYAPVSTTTPTTYIQKIYTANLLRAIQAANPILESLHVTQALPQSAVIVPSASSSQQATLPSLSPGSTTLSHLCTLGSSDPDIAWPLFQHLTTELLTPAPPSSSSSSSSSPKTSRRPPTLICIDSLAHAMTLSRYRSSSFDLIHAHQLSLIAWFMSCLSGATHLGNGGMVLAATSESNSPAVPSLRLALAQLEAEHADGTQAAAAAAAARDPFRKYDEHVMSVFEPGNVTVQRLPGVGRAGARGLMEYWARSGVMGAKVDEGTVGEEWVLSGGGLVGELERRCVRGRVGQFG